VDEIPIVSFDRSDVRSLSAGVATDEKVFERLSSM
jgi:hypothetical protein